MDYLDVLYPEEPEVKEGFKIRNLDGANWAACKITKANSAIAEIETQANMMRQKIAEWEAKAKQPYESTWDTMKMFLNEWVESEVKDLKRKYIDLLGVRAGFRSTPETVEVTDEAGAIEYCEKEHPELVRAVTKKSLDKKGIMKLWREKSEVILGTNISSGHENFYIKES